MRSAVPKRFRAWDRVEKCLIPEEEIAIMADGAILTKQPEAESYRGYVWVPETISIDVEWSTGLVDKNNKPIYAGDILKSGAIFDDQMLVVWYQPGCAFQLVHGNRCEPLKILKDDDFYKGFDWEVIGNTHEPPYAS